MDARIRLARYLAEDAGGAQQDPERFSFWP